MHPERHVRSSAPPVLLSAQGRPPTAGPCTEIRLRVQRQVNEHRVSRGNQPLDDLQHGDVTNPIDDQVPVAVPTRCRKNFPAEPVVSVILDQFGAKVLQGFPVRAVKPSCGCGRSNIRAQTDACRATGARERSGH